MNYFISKPANVETIDPVIYASIIENHGSYDAFNEKIIAGCNTDDMIARFNEVIGETASHLEDVNITLYSGIEQQEILGGVVTSFEPGDVAAVATKLHGIPYIAIDTDLIMMNPNDLDDKTLCSMVGNILGHEMVHYNQMTRGDLDIADEGLVWKGTVYPHGVLQMQIEEIRRDCTTTDEFQFRLMQSQIELPWEFEAYGAMLQGLDIDVAYPAPHWHALMLDLQARYAMTVAEKDL